MKKFLIFIIIAWYLPLSSTNVFAQLWDNYDGVDGLTYTSEDGTYWVVNSGQYEAQTGSVSTPEHSYSSFDMTGKITSWNLSNANTNEWIGWMDLNRSSVSGWGSGNYNCGLVLAANNSDFNSITTTGYGIGYRDGGSPSDELVLFKFSAGIVGGTTALPGTSTEILSSGYAYDEGDNGINFYVKLESDGKWTIKYKTGSQLSDADAINPSNYSDGTATSSLDDETYRGASYKYVGWVYAHNSAAGDRAYFDNLGFAQNGSLPVELSSFSASIVNEGIKLEWRTETEVNNYGFDVERSASSLGTRWNVIGFMKGFGNSNSPREYSFLDKNITCGEYAYRLKQIDNDGTFEYSKILEVTVNVPLKYELSQNYPNPFNPAADIEFTIPQAGMVTLKVYNTLGEELAVLINGFIEPGIHIVNFNASGLNSGIYFYKLESGDFVQVKKMILLK